MKKEVLIVGGIVLAFGTILWCSHSIMETQKKIIFNQHLMLKQLQQKDMQQQQYALNVAEAWESRTPIGFKIGTLPS